MAMSPRQHKRDILAQTSSMRVLRCHAQRLSHGQALGYSSLQKMCPDIRQDGQGVRSRHLLEARRDVFVDYDYERLRTLIDAQEDCDPRAQLEALYRQT